MIEPETIDRAVSELAAHDEVLMATTSEPITEAVDVLNPTVVKVVIDDDSYATSFSRNPIPWPNQAVTRHGSIAAALRNEPALLFLLESTLGFMCTGAIFFCSSPAGRSLNPSGGNRLSNCARSIGV